MAAITENKETITRSRLVGLKDICVAAVTTNDEEVYAAEVPVRLAKAIAATVKDTFSVEYTYSDDEVEDTVETYEKTEIEIEVNRLTPGDYALLFDTLYKYGFLVKADLKLSLLSTQGRKKTLLKGKERSFTRLS